MFLVWRTQRDVLAPLSPLTSPLVKPTASIPSPLSLPTATSLRTVQPIPPTGTPAVNAATLEAIRATRPTATPPSPSGIRLPYVSPDTWRRWALRILAAAALLTYIGLRLRRDQ